MHQSYKLVLKIDSEIHRTTYHFNYNQVRRYIRSDYLRDECGLNPADLQAKVYFRSALADVFGGQNEELIYEGKALGY